MEHLNQLKFWFWTEWAGEFFLGSRLIFFFGIAGVKEIGPKISWDFPNCCLMSSVYFQLPIYPSTFLSLSKKGPCLLP